MSRDIRTVPLNRLRKRELRALIVQMRLRHTREIQELLAAVPPDAALSWCFDRIRRKPIDETDTGDVIVYDGYLDDPSRTFRPGMKIELLDGTLGTVVAADRNTLTCRRSTESRAREPEAASPTKSADS